MLLGSGAIMNEQIGEFRFAVRSDAGLEAGAPCAPQAASN